MAKEQLRYCLITIKHNNEIKFYSLLQHYTLTKSTLSGFVVLSNHSAVGEFTNYTFDLYSNVEIITDPRKLASAWDLVIAHQNKTTPEIVEGLLEKKRLIKKFLQVTQRRDRGLESGNGRELPPLSPPAKKNKIISGLHVALLLLTISFLPAEPTYAIDCDYDGYQTLEEKINLESNRLTNWISDSCVLNSNLKLNWLAACGKDDYSLVTLDSLRLDNLHMLVCNDTHCLDNGAVSPHVFDASELSRHGSIVSK